MDIGGTSGDGGSGLDSSLLDTLTQPISQPGTAGQTQTTPNTPASKYPFAGREFSDQKAAEKSYKETQSGLTKAQERLKHYEELLKDPRAISAISKDPELAQGLMKLGIDIRDAEPGDVQADKQRTQGGQQADRLPPRLEALERQMKVQLAQNTLDREMTLFQRTIKRELPAGEHDAIMDMVAERPWLKVGEAYKLLYADRDHADALKRMESKGQKGGRVKPPPFSLPGTTLDLKKPTKDMNEEEYREALRQDVNEMMGS